jgi:hypothetical protein
MEYFRRPVTDEINAVYFRRPEADENTGTSSQQVQLPDALYRSSINIQSDHIYEIHQHPINIIEERDTISHDIDNLQSSYLTYISISITYPKQVLHRRTFDTVPC